MVVYWTSYIGCLTGFCEPLLPPCRFPNSLKNVLHDRCDRISLIEVQWMKGWLVYALQAFDFIEWCSDCLVSCTSSRRNQLCGQLRLAKAGQLEAGRLCHPCKSTRCDAPISDAYFIQRGRTQLQNPLALLQDHHLQWSPRKPGNDAQSEAQRRLLLLWVRLLFVVYVCMRDWQCEHEHDTVSGFILFD